MGMLSYTQAVELIRQYIWMADFVGPRTSTLIEQAEKTLDLLIPNPYRQFLLDYGAGGFGSSEIYGVINENFVTSGVPDAIWLTLQQRKLGLPPNYIVVFSTGDGNFLCLDVHGEQNSPIITYQPGYSLNEQIKGLVAENFGGFLLQEIRMQIDVIYKYTVVQNAEKQKMN